MSIAAIVTGGFGGFGDVAHVVTDGYDIGAPAIVTPPNEPGLEFTLSANRLHFTLSGASLGYTLPVNRLHYTIPGEQ